MSNQKYVELLKLGVREWNKWREANPETRANLNGADFFRADLSGANFKGIHLKEVEIREANLSGADLSDANLRDANLRGTNLSGASLFEAYLRKADLRGAYLRGADLRNANLSGADLSGANLDGVNLNGANLRNTRLRGVDLRDANLSGVNLSGAHLARSILKNADLSDAYSIVSSSESAWRDRVYLSEADLSGANLSRAKLRDARIGLANLNKANINGADLSGSDLSGSDLSGANLNGANLSGADLTKSKLVDTTLLRTDLSGCNIFGVSVWNIETDENTKQENLVITKKNESIITVDNLEVAQFIYLMLNNQKIRDVINTITSKVVLILGRFTPERKTVLDAIREELRNNNFTPVLFDFDKPDDRNFIETVSTLAHMARFVIADFTDPKIVLQEAQCIIPNIAIPFVPIFLSGSGFEPVTLYDLRKGRTTVLDTFCYNDTEHLLENLNQMIIRPAESLAGKLNERNPLK